MLKINTAIIQALIVLIPTYWIAYMTDKMVYTIPMLAAMSFIAASYGKTQNDDDRRKTDEDGGSQQDG